MTQVPNYRSRIGAVRCGFAVGPHRAETALNQYELSERDKTRRWCGLGRLNDEDLFKENGLLISAFSALSHLTHNPKKNRVSVVQKGRKRTDRQTILWRLNVQDHTSAALEERSSVARETHYAV